MYNLAWADEAHHRVTQSSTEFIFLEFKLIKLCGTLCYSVVNLMHYRPKYQLYMRCTPSSISTLCCQPRACSFEGSVSLRMVPSGLVLSKVS